MHDHQKKHRPAGACKHRHRFRTTRIPSNARTRAPPPDIPRETLGSVLCYIPSMLDPRRVSSRSNRTASVYTARGSASSLARFRCKKTACVARNSAHHMPPILKAPRQTSEDYAPANYTAQFTYPRRFARRTAHDCGKLQRIGLERGPDQRGWTVTDSGTRQAAEVTPALSTARGTALAQLHASRKKTFWSSVSLYSFSKCKTKQGSPGISKKTKFAFQNSQPRPSPICVLQAI
jgi:hypothetical protein